MNQILQVEMKKKSKAKKDTEGKLELNSIQRIFSVILIVFAITMIASSSWAMMQNQVKEKDEPNVTINKIGNEAVVNVATMKPITKFVYNWNGTGDIDLPLSGTVSEQQKITIPRGNNILNLKITDYYGNVKEFQKQYIYESNDMEKPTIELAVVGNNVKITAKDETQMLYITYKWDNEQETRVDATRQDQTEIVQTIPVKEGDGKLTIVASDASDNIQTKEQQFKGVKKSKIDVVTDGDKLIIKVSDDIGVKQFKYVFNNGVLNETDPNVPINMKEFEYEEKLQQGDNHIIITVINMEDVETVFEGVCTY